MQLTLLTEQEFSSLRAFMSPLWHETYGDFLPREQIEFLLDKYFSKEGLQFYREQGYEYRNIMSDQNERVGVLVYVQREKDTYMDKLYLLPQARGKGYPAFVFAYLCSFGKDVRLSANQKNARALKCYQKNGFVIEEKMDIQLGHGMVNCDYILCKKAQK